MLRYLAPSSKVLVSVPNTCNWVLGWNYIITVGASIARAATQAIRFSHAPLISSIFDTAGEEGVLPSMQSCGYHYAIASSSY